MTQSDLDTEKEKERRSMHYWLHRCKHEGGLDILDRENRLTIGFSPCASDEETVRSIREKDRELFEERCKVLYAGKCGGSDGPDGGARHRGDAQRSLFQTRDTDPGDRKLKRQQKKRGKNGNCDPEW